MADVHRNPVWTHSDRLCGQCGAHIAQRDDWLCTACRSSLERNWNRLTQERSSLDGAGGRQLAPGTRAGERPLAGAQKAHP